MFFSSDQKLNSAVSVIAAIMFLFFQSGCTKNDSPTEPSHLIDDEVPVGVFLDLSGPTKTFGQETYQGIKLAIEEHNSNENVPYKIKLIARDTKGSVETTKQVVTELIDQDRVVALIGEVATQLSLAAAKIAEEKKVPMLSPGTATPKLGEVGPYIFRTCLEDSEQGALIAQFVKNYLKASRVAVFREISSEYSGGLADRFKEKFKSLDGKVTREVVYRQGQADFSEQVAELKKDEIDAIVMPGYFDEAAKLATALKASDIRVNLIGGDIWENSNSNLADSPLNGAYFSSHFHADKTDDKTRDFVKNYKNQFDTTPHKFAALGYDAGEIITQSISKIDRVTPKDVKDILAKLKSHTGVTGDISVNESSKVRRGGVILQIKNGQSSYVTTIR